MRFFLTLGGLILFSPFYLLLIYPWIKILETRLFHFTHSDAAVLERSIVCRVCGKVTDITEK